MSYFGTSGPKFVLRNENDSIAYTYTLPAPHTLPEEPWKMAQDQRRDVNDIMQVDNLQFEYQNIMTWRPTDISGNTVLSKLLTIINWRTNNDRSIQFYPHSDKFINFNVVVTEGTPYYFTKIPYNGFTITVVSEELFDRIPDPDALAAIDFGDQIAIGSDDMSVVN